MDEELSLDNILSEEEVSSLFNVEEENNPNPKDKSQDQEENDKNKNEEPTEVNAENLFTDEPESVSREEAKGDSEESTTSKEASSSPKNNFYSSIAKALKEDGIFPDLEDQEVDSITDPQTFRELVENQIRQGLEDKQKRIDEALNYGIEPSNIKRFENTISYLDSIKDEDLQRENSDGEKLRKSLIYQDYINRGYSEERATREVQKSLNAGTDIDDAKEALKSNKEYFEEQYSALINEAKTNQENEIKERKEKEAKLKKSILEDKNLFGDLTFDLNTRRKIYDNILKPVYKDPETGNVYTAIQKYQKENSEEFAKTIGIIFTLTDGFKNFNGLIKNQVRKEVNKGIKELENTLNNTRRSSNGNLQFVTNVEDDPESIISKGWNLDLS